MENPGKRKPRNNETQRSDRGSSLLQFQLIKSVALETLT